MRQPKAMISSHNNVFYFISYIERYTAKVLKSPAMITLNNNSETGSCLVFHRPYMWIQGDDELVTFLMILGNVSHKFPKLAFLIGSGVQDLITSMEITNVRSMLRITTLVGYIQALSDRGRPRSLRWLSVAEQERKDA